MHRVYYYESTLGNFCGAFVFGPTVGQELPANTAARTAVAVYQTTRDACVYNGITFPNGTTTTFDCPLNPQACYSNAAMLPRWTCKNGQWCNQQGYCFKTADGRT